MLVGQVIDANANRAREALRVMEEAARFVLRDSELSARIKTLRHGLASGLPAGLERYRDVSGDAGTEVHTPRELSRQRLYDVVIASGKRLGEALRVLEEYGKLQPGTDVLAIKQLRYGAYQIEQALLARLAHGRGGGRVQWRVCVLLTRSLCRLPWERVLQDALEAGADCVQVREKGMEGNELLNHAGHVVRITRTQSDAAVIVNDRPDIALLINADGVHLGQGDIPCDAARRLVGGALCIGVSTSRLPEAEQAWAMGADYCGVGPMFETTTKHKPVLAGPSYLRQYIAWGKLPHLAIGGVMPASMPELVEAGVQGVAVSSAVCGAEQPGQVVKELLSMLKGADAPKKPSP
jgi:thiamine-phosphate pyrophosphorylase